MLKVISAILILMVGGSTVAQLNAYLDAKIFKSPQGAMLETFVEVYASSIKYKKNDSLVGKCEVEVTQILKDVAKDSIVGFFKKNITNNETHKDDIYENLMEVQRFVIDNKVDYELEVTIVDLNDPFMQEQSVTRGIKSNYSEFQAEISDIQLVAAYSETRVDNMLSKSGFDIVPLLTDFYPKEYEKFVYYFEVYNSIEQFGADGKFLVYHYIENDLTGNVAGNYGKVKKYSSAEVIPVLHAFDINSLTSGNYHLVVEVKNKENEVVVQNKIPFTRLNERVDMKGDHLKDVDYQNTFVNDMPVDSLDEFIYCLYPICEPLERRILDNQVKYYSDTLKRQFIYSFWKNMQSQHPYDEWLKYKEQIQLVDKMFGTTVKEGYETDRGRIYLKYGPPYNVDDRPNEPSYVPYQIWHYYKIDKFNNIKFVFYLPDLVTNDYALLHSNMRGEIQNFKWQKELSNRNTQGGNIDDPNEGNYNHFGSNAGTLFENP